jgi:MFS family permease
MGNKSNHGAGASWLWCARRFSIVVLDFSVVNVALPSIRDSLKFSPQNLQWVASAYALTFGGFLLLGGRLADLVGRRTVLMWGVVLFSVASLLAGFSALTGGYAQSLLIAGRGAQGLGGALIAPCRFIYPQHNFCGRCGAQPCHGHLLGSVATAGFACGNLLGGILTGQFGWPSIFYINVPIGIALVILAPRLVPHRDGEAQTTGLDFTRLDISGAISVTIGLVALVYALVGAEQNGWSSPRTGGAFAISAVLLTAFVIIEKRAKAPLVPLSIFRRRTLTTANIVVALVDGVNVATILFLSLYLQGVKGFSPEATGFAFLPLAGWMIVAANLSPRVGDTLWAAPGHDRRHSSHHVVRLVFIAFEPK